MDPESPCAAPTRGLRGPRRPLKPGKDAQSPRRVNRAARPQAAERLQRTLDGIYVVGGTAAALWAGHRTSHDAAHHMPDLEHRFSEVLDRLEALPGWITARIRRPHLILGHLHGVVAVSPRCLRKRRALVLNQPRVHTCPYPSTAIPEMFETLIPEATS